MLLSGHPYIHEHAKVTQALPCAHYEAWQSPPLAAHADEVPCQMLPAHVFAEHIKLCCKQSTELPFTVARLTTVIQSSKSAALVKHSGRIGA